LTTDIVIVSYNDRDILKSCIESIEKNCKNYKIYIEDNNPPNQNNGFTKAVNNGIKKGESPFIWLLNSDAIVVDENTQQALIDQFMYSDRVGIVGSQQIDPENHDLIRHGGTLSMLPGRHKGGYVSMGHCRFPEKQTWVNGASMMIRRKMVNEIGLMDEDLFLLCSDSDYCLTARKNGYEVWYTPYSKVYHRLNASKNVSDWHKKDMEAFMKKWDIKILPDNNLVFGKEFEKLDRFP